MPVFNAHTHYVTGNLSQLMTLRLLNSYISLYMICCVSVGHLLIFLRCSDWWLKVCRHVTRDHLHKGKPDRKGAA